MTHLPQTPLRTTLVTWLVRVGLVGIILYGIQSIFGPFDFLWWAWPAYGIISLISSLLLTRFKNAQTDKLNAVLDQANTTGSDT